jgi:hypothetical protein
LANMHLQALRTIEYLGCAFDFSFRRVVCGELGPCFATIFFSTVLLSVAEIKHDSRIELLHGLPKNYTVQ